MAQSQHEIRGNIASLLYRLDNGIISFTQIAAVASSPLWFETDFHAQLGDYLRFSIDLPTRPVDQIHLAAYVASHCPADIKCHLCKQFRQNLQERVNSMSPSPLTILPPFNQEADVVARAAPLESSTFANVLQQGEVVEAATREVDLHQSEKGKFHICSPLLAADTERLPADWKHLIDDSGYVSHQAVCSAGSNPIQCSMGCGKWLDTFYNASLHMMTAPEMVNDTQGRALTNRKSQPPPAVLQKGTFDSGLGNVTKICSARLNGVPGLRTPVLTECPYRKYHPHLPCPLQCPLQSSVAGGRTDKRNARATSIPYFSILDEYAFHTHHNHPGLACSCGLILPDPFHFGLHIRHGCTGTPSTLLRYLARTWSGYVKNLASAPSVAPPKLESRISWASIMSLLPVITACAFVQQALPQESQEQAIVEVPESEHSLNEEEEVNEDDMEESNFVPDDIEADSLEHQTQKSQVEGSDLRKAEVEESEEEEEEEETPAHNLRSLPGMLNRGINGDLIEHLGQSKSRTRAVYFVRDGIKRSKRWKKHAHDNIQKHLEFLEDEFREMPILLLAVRDMPSASFPLFPGQFLYQDIFY